jgi:hypothetical protein
MVKNTLEYLSDYEGIGLVKSVVGLPLTPETVVAEVWPLPVSCRSVANCFLP